MCNQRIAYSTSSFPSGNPYSQKIDNWPPLRIIRASGPALTRLHQDERVGYEPPPSFKKNNCTPSYLTHVHQRPCVPSCRCPRLQLLKAFTTFPEPFLPFGCGFIGLTQSHLMPQPNPHPRIWATFNSPNYQFSFEVPESRPTSVCFVLLTPPPKESRRGNGHTGRRLLDYTRLMLLP